MTKTEIKIFEPPMCCSTGMCGPTIDEKLVAFNDLMAKLKKESYVVERYMLTTDADAFQSEEQVMAIVKDEQLEGLPITMVGGKVLRKGSYPTYEEIVGAANDGGVREDDNV